MRENSQDKAEKGNSQDKAERILSIFTRLRQGKVVNKMEFSQLYGVSPRTIQRDIADVQCFLQNQGNETGETQEIVFDRKAGGYRLETRHRKYLNAKEILALSKVLLESRVLMKAEMFPIINSLIGLCSDDAGGKEIKESLNNEMHHYVELHHGKELVDRLWVLESAVREQKYIEITYTKLKKKETVKRKVKPVGVMFSEFYFYLTAYIEGIDKQTAFQNPDDIFPTIYRVDRLENIEILDEHFSIPYSERFEEGEFRKRIQFMYGGRLRRIKFKYTGNSLDSILDRLPTAEIVKEEEGGVVIKAEVFGDGVDMWLRSQGDDIVVE